MSGVSWTVERTGYAVVQDLGRAGHARWGIAGNGASDQRSARTANALVGNADDAALLEVTGSELVLRPDVDALVAVAGAASRVGVGAASAPVGQPLVVPAGECLTVPAPVAGLRTYVALNGELEAERHLGSVAPDPLLGVGRVLGSGDVLRVTSAYRSADHQRELPLYRLGRIPDLTGRHRIGVVAGPDLGRLVRPESLLEPLVVDQKSDHVGLRLSGPPIELRGGEEILSRGVPVGAVETPPGGSIIVLLRGRLVTAGYPVVAVVGSAHLDRLGQARPGDRIELFLTGVEEERAALRRWEDQHRRLAERVRNAFEATGIGGVVDARHGTHPTHREEHT